MSKSGKIGLAFDVAACRLFGRRKPLVAAWSVTNQCNRECLYCDSPLLGGDELSKDQGLRLIDMMADAGVRSVSFTGGEPLIHQHIDDYIGRVVERGMSCGVNTNGILVNNKIDVLRKVKYFKLSLDGAPDIHDAIRGGDCARHVFDALETARTNGITATLLAVLTRKNLDQVDYLVSVAEKFGATVAFQPATGHALKSDRDNPFSPEVEGYRACIDRVIRIKKSAKGRLIGNSLPGLLHLRQWPAPVKMKCDGVRVSARVEPDGRLFHCGRMIRHSAGFDTLELGFAEAFNRLQQVECDFCWCAHRVEANMILGLSLPSVIDALRAKLF